MAFYRPRFSANGEEIFFVGYPPGEPSGVFSVPVNGAELTRVVEFDDPSLAVFTVLTIRSGQFFLTFAEYESDIVVVDLEWE